MSGRTANVRSAKSSSLRKLNIALFRGQLRWLLRTGFIGLTVAAMFASAAYVVGTYVELSTRVGAQGQQFVGLHRWLPVWVFVMALHSWLGFAIARFPSRMEMARKIDHEAGGQERLSTALEYCAHSENVVHDALLASASEFTRAGRVVGYPPIPLRGAVVAIVTTLSVTVVGYFLIDYRFARPQIPAAQGHKIPHEWREGVVDDLQPSQLREVADSVRAEAERRSDPHLEAIARNFEELADEIEAQGGVDQAIRSELDDVLEHVQATLGSDAAAVTQPLRTSLSAGSRDPAAEGSDGTTESGALSAHDSFGPTGSEGAPGPQAPDSDPGVFEGRAAEDVHPEFSAPEPMAQRGPGGEDRSEFEGDGLALPDGRGESGEVLHAEAPPGGAEGGAGAGASESPGLGRQEGLGEPDPADLAWDPVSSDPLRIDGESPKGTKRVRLDAAPHEDLAGILETGLGTVEWGRGSEVTVVKESIALDVRPAAARFFSSRPHD